MVLESTRAILDVMKSIDIRWAHIAILRKQESSKLFRLPTLHLKLSYFEVSFVLTPELCYSFAFRISDQLNEQTLIAYICPP